MIILIYFFVFIFSFILSTLLGATIGHLVGTIFDKLIGYKGFWIGVTGTILSYLLLSYIIQNWYPKEIFSLSYKIVAGIPILLNAIRTFYVGNQQNKTSSEKYGELNLKMKLDFSIPIGLIVGIIISFIIT